MSVFGKQAENANRYLSKGKMVLVEGRMRSDPRAGGPVVYQRQDGTPAAAFEIVANSVHLLGLRAEDGAGAQQVGDEDEALL